MKCAFPWLVSYSLLALSQNLHGVSVRSFRSVPGAVHCEWGPYGSWSACDGCSKTQTRYRSIAVYPQFHGRPCTGSSTRTQTCSPTQACPLEEGCGGRFRCQSGKCISQSLVCNGDYDCEEDGLDEQKCENKPMCDLQQPPPNVELTGKGFDAARQKERGAVINTKSFGGLCRKTFSGDHMGIYRLPESVLRYSFQVTVKNDFSEELFDSSWHYYLHSERHEKTTGTVSGYDDFVFHDEVLKKQSKNLMIIKSDVDVAQFQNQEPEYLPLAEEFWKALLAVPVVYSYAAYRTVLESFGTHYMSEGTLGGQFRLFLAVSKDVLNKLKTVQRDYKRCEKTTHTVLFFISWTTEHCDDGHYKETHPFKEVIDDDDFSTKAVGGDLGFGAKLSQLNKATPVENGRTFMQWSGSVKNFPTVIKKKLRSLHELVKEVPCAGVKRLHLKKAIQTYLSESDPCHCGECRNNGLRVLDQGVCSCVCKPGTSGEACEKGTPTGEQPGVIDGEWACWASWSSCREGKRSRSRSCSRPAPSGGKDCIGNVLETTSCDDEGELHYLRCSARQQRHSVGAPLSDSGMFCFSTMEPHCFDDTFTPRKSCEMPPFLPNGFVLHPKDEYPVGSKIEYTCTDGHYIYGNPIAECQENLKWLRYQMECKRTACDLPQLSPDVIGRPWKFSYSVGEIVSLSCPQTKVIEGPTEIQCNAGLSWSPQSIQTSCKEVSIMKPTSLPMQCQPWENLAENKCVCKMPYECKSSLEICATDVQRARTQRLSVCKVQALRCLGHQYTPADHSACQWPQRTSAACTHCTPWEHCDEQTNSCRCKSVADCSSPGTWIRVCVQQDGASAPETVTECEAGVRRCRGESLRVVRIQPCHS